MVDYVFSNLDKIVRNFVLLGLLDCGVTYLVSGGQTLHEILGLDFNDTINSKIHNGELILVVSGWTYLMLKSLYGGGVGDS
jgi:hypothetical protein